MLNSPEDDGVRPTRNLLTEVKFLAIESFVDASSGLKLRPLVQFIVRLIGFRAP
jgi:hypothetical protein